MKSSFPSFAASMLLAACASAPPAPPPAAPPAPVACPVTISVTDEALGFYRATKQMHGADLAKEMASLAGAPEQPLIAIKKAFILAAMRGNGDLARAQVQLDSIINANTPDAQALKPLAQLLAASYAQQRHQNEHADRLAQQLKESQRRTDQLNDTLERLKTIELALPARPGSTGTSATGK